MSYRNIASTIRHRQNKLNDDHPKAGTPKLLTGLKALFVMEADFTFDPDKQLRGLA